MNNASTRNNKETKKLKDFVEWSGNAKINSKVLVEFEVEVEWGNSLAILKQFLDILFLRNSQES